MSRPLCSIADISQMGKSTMRLLPGVRDRVWLTAGSSPRAWDVGPCMLPATRRRHGVVRTVTR